MENSFGDLLVDKNEFKKMFGEIAKENGFEKVFEGWFREYSEVIQVLELQKSNFGDYYYLNIKIFIQGVFGNKYVKSKKLVKTNNGEIFIRQSDHYSNLLRLDFPLDDNERKEGLKKLFQEYIVPISNETTTKDDIIKFYKRGDFFISPSVMEELGVPSS